MRLWRIVTELLFNVFLADLTAVPLFATRDVGLARKRFCTFPFVSSHWHIWHCYVHMPDYTALLLFGFRVQMRDSKQGEGQNNTIISTVRSSTSGSYSPSGSYWDGLQTNAWNIVYSITTYKTLYHKKVKLLRVKDLHIFHSEQESQRRTCMSLPLCLKHMPFSIIFLAWHVLPHCGNTWNIFLAQIPLTFFCYALQQWCAG